MILDIPINGIIKLNGIKYKVLEKPIQSVKDCTNCAFTDITNKCYNQCFLCWELEREDKKKCIL